MNLLILIISLSIIFFLILLFIPSNQIILLKKVSLIFSLVLFFLSLLLWIFFDENEKYFSFTTNYSWIDLSNIYYLLGVDGISVFFIILTTFLIPICILSSWSSIKYRTKEFLLMLLLTEILLINVFSILDLVLFYLFFESVLIPMFIIIGVWGARQRKMHAAYQFFFYTLIGSILMLLGIILIYLHLGTTDILILLNSDFSPYRQLILWLSFFISFAIKVPMLPFHIWLPEAHVEAPTSGSVILAGVLLKLGTYGIIRFMIPMFPYANNFFKPLIFTLCLIAIIYASCTTIRQIDLKKIIAYSSVVHMNFSLLGLFTNNSTGIEGSLYIMLGHGIVSSALFLCIGIIYDRYHTRNILYYGGLINIMPLFGLFFLIFTLANIGMPGTVNFVGEFLVLMGIFKVNTLVGTLAGLSMVLGAVYAIWLYNRIMFGFIKTGVDNEKLNKLLVFSDLTRREVHVFLPLAFLAIILGIYPLIILNVLTISINNYIIFI